MMKLAIPDLEKYEGFDLIATKQQEAISNLTNHIDTEIRERITALGVDINNHDAIKRDFQFIEREGDEFKHLFYLPLKKLVISIHKEPTITMCYDNEDFKNNTVTVHCDYKYY